MSLTEVEILEDLGTSEDVEEATEATEAAEADEAETDAEAFAGTLPEVVGLAGVVVGTFGGMIRVIFGGAVVVTTGTERQKDKIN